ncbi:MAG: DUF5615 family PIN-like protein [Anaerolineae bacterium]|nr:DUF5615 family PIN-like protein [Anaerolineae bacterium]
MNFLADEGVDAPIVAELRQAGFQVAYVAELSPSIDDSTVLSMANQQEAVLITQDKDFGNLVFQQRLISHGVILLRLHGIDPRLKAHLLLKSIRDHQDQLEDSFTVITQDRIRIRPRLN